MFSLFRLHLWAVAYLGMCFVSGLGSMLPVSQSPWIMWTKSVAVFHLHHFKIRAQQAWMSCWCAMCLSKVVFFLLNIIIQELYLHLQITSIQKREGHKYGSVCGFWLFNIFWSSAIFTSLPILHSFAACWNFVSNYLDSLRAALWTPLLSYKLELRIWKICSQT